VLAVVPAMASGGMGLSGLPSCLAGPPGAGVAAASGPAQREPWRPAQPCLPSACCSRDPPDWRRADRGRTHKVSDGGGRETARRFCAQPGRSAVITIEELDAEDPHEAVRFYQRILLPSFRAAELVSWDGFIAG
jgi:hypothetical protein